MDVMSSSVSPSHLAPPSDVVPLLNSVIDVCLVYGVDETSSREIPVTEEGVREGGREGGKEEFSIDPIATFICMIPYFAIQWNI